MKEECAKIAYRFVDIGDVFSYAIVYYNTGNPEMGDFQLELTEDAIDQLREEGIIKDSEHKQLTSLIPSIKNAQLRARASDELIPEILKAPSYLIDLVFEFRQTLKKLMTAKIQECEYARR